MAGEIIEEPKPLTIEERLQTGFTFCIGTGDKKQDVFVIYGNYKKDSSEWIETVEGTKEEYRKTMIKTLKSAKKVLPWKGVYLSDNPIRVIWIQPTDSISSLTSTVAHEALHATCDIMRYVGIPLTPASEEAYTYLMDYMVENIIWNILENPDFSDPKIEEEKELI
jgi:hypothetical protein